MKLLSKVAFASLALGLAVLAPVSAYASSNAQVAHTHSAVYHDRTPHVHTRGVHTHHQH